MARTSPVAAATNGTNGSTGEPTLQQQLILDAYFANPNAAAVAREHRKSERNVRRIVETFADLLHERRRQQDARLKFRAVSSPEANFTEVVPSGIAPTRRARTF